jgi:hypothetical protein
MCRGNVGELLLACVVFFLNLFSLLPLSHLLYPFTFSLFLCFSAIANNRIMLAWRPRNRWGDVVSSDLRGCTAWVALYESRIPCYAVEVWSRPRYYMRTVSSVPGDSWCMNRFLFQKASNRSPRLSRQFLHGLP